MMNAYSSITLMITTFLVGCSSVATYPVCVMQDEVSVQQWNTIKENLETSIRVIDPNAKVNIVPSVAIIEATSVTHSRLRDIWPSQACISTVRTDGDDILWRECQRVVAEYVHKPWTSWPGEIKKGQVYCKTP